MTTPTSAAARLVRALGLSVLVVALAAVAHALGGGPAPAPGLVLALVALSLPVTVLVTGRRVTWPVALAVLAVGQLLLHHAFAVLGACGQVAPDAGAHAHHGAAAHLAATCASGAASGAPLVDGRAMAVWHAVATVVTALVVAGAERAAVHVVGLLAPLLRAPAELVAPVLVHVLPHDDSAAPVATLHLRGAPSRRGPPSVALPPTGTPRD
ncbi:hypothetical protein [Cellulomonas persica]|uniref:Uncharacterized protein n=1 Tax=Cellulomonas persica TaxID=76861 RepID=A0A510USU8_9CELL|nr:hypothetical protein [Cellulomonas persica]GEK17744.1 hypothetical protein CPE01_14770 [Cellulomonas persica]